MCLHVEHVSPCQVSVSVLVLQQSLTCVWLWWYNDQLLLYFYSSVLRLKVPLCYVHIICFGEYHIVVHFSEYCFMLGAKRWEVLWDLSICVKWHFMCSHDCIEFQIIIMVCTNCCNIRPFWQCFSCCNIYCCRFIVCFRLVYVRFSIYCCLTQYSTVLLPFLF